MEIELLEKQINSFTSDVYVAAFKKINISDEQKKMLWEHYHAPDKTLTAGRMAEIMGYSYKIDESGNKVRKPKGGVIEANGHYGELAGLVCEKLGLNIPPKSINLGVLATFKKPEKNWFWIMRPQVAEALEKLGWVGNKNRTYMFITSEEDNAENVKLKPAEWSCSKTICAGDTVFVYITGKGVCYEWRVISDADKEGNKWWCKVKFIKEFDQLINIQELRDVISSDEWAPPHQNFRGNSSLEIPDSVVKKIYALRPNSFDISKEIQDIIRVEENFDKRVAESLKLPAAERHKRLKKANKSPSTKKVLRIEYERNPDVVAEVLIRAKGKCEDCNQGAPFIRIKDGTPYLEVHHRIRLADGGEDTVENAVALCPNCHRKAHYGTKEMF